MFLAHRASYVTLLLLLWPGGGSRVAEIPVIWGACGGFTKEIGFGLGGWGEWGCAVSRGECMHFGGMHSVYTGEGGRSKHVFRGQGRLTWLERRVHTGATG